MGGLGLITSAFTVLTIIIGGVCIMLFTSTKTLRDTAGDQERRIKQLEEERTRDKATISSQETEIKIWKDAVTGESQLADISALLTTHHNESVNQGQAILAALGHVGVALDSVDDSMSTLVTKLGGPK